MMRGIFATMLVLASCSAALSQRVDFSTGPDGPQPINPKAPIKQDVLGLTLGMTKAQAKERLQAAGCVKPEREYASGIFTSGVKCETPSGKIKLLFTPGSVAGEDMEVVKSMDLIFPSSDGARQVFLSVSNQYNAKSALTVQEQARRLKDCDTPRVRYCSDIALFNLSYGLELRLTLNSQGDDEQKTMDTYWLQFFSSKELPAEAARKEALQRNRPTATTPKF